MMELLDFLGEKARGFIITLVGAGTGTLPAVEKGALPQFEMTGIELEPLNKLVLLLTGIVALLTIISYIYKFVRFLAEIINKKKEPE